jgi:non-ribosomal peptide synthetase component F
MRRRKHQSFAGSMYSFAVPDRVSESVETYRLTRGLTAFQVMLAGFYVAMSAWTSSTDLIIGAPYANRNSTDEMQAVGCFVNMIPLRVSLSGSDSFEEICRRTVTAVAFGHRHVSAPISEITRALQLTRSSSHSPLFQVTFSVQQEIGRPSPHIGASGGSTVFRSVRVVDNQLSKYDLITTFYVSDGGMRGEITYQTELFDRADVAAMSHEYLELLPTLLAEPEKAIQELL